MNAVLIAAPTAQSQKPAARPNEESKSTQPFGAVLSGQMAQHANRDKTHAHKTETKQDNTPAAAPSPDGVIALPADMLVSLIQQGQAAATATTGTSDALPVDHDAAQASLKNTAATTTQISALPDSALPETGKVDIATPGDTGTAVLPTQVDTNKTSATTARQSAGEASLAAAQPEAAKTSDSLQRFGSVLESANTVARKEHTLPEIAPAAPQATATQSNLAAAIAPQNLAAPSAQLTVPTPVGRKDWGDDFGQKITWLATSNHQSAELHLNPPQLGPLDVVISVSGDQASAFFSSPHAAVRDAVEQAMPKLREMMADNGITLGNTSVNDQARDNDRNAHQARSGGSQTGSISDNMAAGTPQPVVLTTPARRHNGLLDTFA